MSEDTEDQRKRIAARGEPIKPIQQRPYSAEMRAVPSPQWDKWNRMQEVELWEAVSLSANLDPDEMPVYLGAYDKFGDDPFRICPAVFLERLMIANSNACSGFGLKQVHELKARCLVSLPEFWPWAVSFWEDVPQEYSSLVKAGPSTVETPKQPSRRSTSVVAASAVKKRREGDILSPLILRAWQDDEAWSRGGEPTTASVFLTLREWAQSAQRPQPLMGVTESGIKWDDGSDNSPKELKKKALGERIKGLKSQP